MRKMIVGTLLVVFLLSGCSNAMADIYDNESKITSDTNSFNLDGIEQEIEGNSYNATIEKMEGMDTVWTLDTEEETTVDISYDITLYNGKIKVALIYPDGELTTLAECKSNQDNSSNSTSLTLPQGEYRIKIIAGENTKFDISLSITDGSFHELGL
ncbi:uncharacterized protein YcfL [Catenibacillus scindens]|jgi:uncharacterized protein YcfL|uniref:Uncharacterized protein YcfL n=1 Tax=Catenibacillus scindens TaxID=673271 RepID=A0A7W8M6C9_9FIRM|nr:hypothetical protein [Catenibacillus scindens]MBB5265447.1 uncharacterized protein YcfL [Catenibacillus scindens]